MQPTALPMDTPVRRGSSRSPTPLSAIASRALTSANWAALSSRRTSFGLRPCSSGAKSTSAATRERNAEASNCETVLVAVRPEVMNDQNSLVPTPPGATTPMPVTTTLLAIAAPLSPDPVLDPKVATRT